ncbi:MAG: flagellar hook assembly protein FlgD [Ilumatobacter sp.]
MDPITAVASPTLTAPIAEIGEAPANTSLDKDAFLKLLVAQLKYQDPSAPTDVSQMMAQTSSLSMVERLDQIAEGIERLGGGAPLSSAASMLGREVVFDTGGFEPVTATVDAVRLVDGDVVLSAGGHEIPLAALLEVKGAAATAPTFTAPAPVAVAPTVADGPDASDELESLIVHDHAN